MGTETTYHWVLEESKSSDESALESLAADAGAEAAITACVLFTYGRRMPSTVRETGALYRCN